MQGPSVESVMEVLRAYGPSVVYALVILALGWTAARWVRRGVRAAMTRAKVDAALLPFVSGMVYYLVLAFVITAVLGRFGIPTASIIAVLGGAALAVGLALQGTLSNFAAGIMLLLFRPFRAGDVIEAGGATGSVVAIEVFTTTLNTADNVQIIMANSSVYGGTIKNYTANETRRNDLVIGVSYEDDLALATDVVRRVLAADPRVLPEPAPLVAVGELADSSVNLVVRPWCRGEDYWGLRFDLTRKLKEELEAAGCSIPFPQRDVHLQQAPKAVSAG